MVAIQEQLLAAVGDRRGVGAADRLCEACVVLFGVDAAAIWSSTGANAGTLGASHLRRPPGPLPLPSSPPVIGRDAPPASRNRMGRGGPLQFPPPLSERSEPLTPGSPSRLHLQDLHRFHGLRPSPPGSALPCPTRPRAGLLTTRQASLDVTDRSVAHPAQRGARRWASTPPVSRRHRQPATGPPDSYPDRTYTGKRRRAYESAVNHLHDQPPTLLDALANRDDGPLRRLGRNHRRQSGMKDTVSHYIPPPKQLTSTASQSFSNNLTMPSEVCRSGVTAGSSVGTPQQLRPDETQHTLAQLADEVF